MSAAADHLAQLAQALLDEERARAEVRSAVHRQAVALRELRALGLPASTVAYRVAHARGLVLALPDRLRLAARLRKRAWRGTRCPDEVALSHGPALRTAPPCDRALPPESQENEMPRVVKRTTVTEEFLDPESTDEEQDEVEEDVDEAEDAEEEPESAAPTPRRRRRRR